MKDTLHGLSIAIAVVLLWQGAAYAQDSVPDYDANYILFEAHPLTSAPLAPLPFNSRAPAPQPELIANGTTPALPVVNSIDRATAETTVAAYEGNIDSMMDVETPYSPELFERLIGLSRAYQQLGQHDEAMATLERAEFLGRVNNGLYSPEQFAVVSMMVENLMAAGRVSEAMQKQQYLLYLQRQHYGTTSKELTPGLERLGDWATTTFATGVHGSTSIGFNFTGSSNRTALSPRSFAIASLDRARFHYFDAIAILIESRDLANPQLPALEAKLLNNLYLAGHRDGLMDNPAFYLAARRHNTGSRISSDEFEYNMWYYEQGRNALMRLRYYQINDPTTDPALILHTALSLADWSLLFNRLNEAKDEYLHAYNFAQQNPSLAKAAELQLNPALPVLLPDFMPLPHSRGYFEIGDDDELQFDGYIDVSFDVLRTGDVRHIRTLGASSNSTPTVERRLRRLLGAAPQRPRLENGVPMPREDVKVRYYFADMRKNAVAINP